MLPGPRHHPGRGRHVVQPHTVVGADPVRVQVKVHIPIVDTAGRRLDASPEGKGGQAGEG